MVVDSPNKKNEYNVGIIGFGPKGLYGLERLLAEIKAHQLTVPVNIHVFNRTGFFGAGDIYRSDQPDYLLMNYANHHIDFNCDKVPPMIYAPFDDFITWLTKRSSLQNHVPKNGFAARAEVGKYLSDCFELLCRHIPKNVKVNTHVNTVVDIAAVDGGFHLKTETLGHYARLRFQKLLITTGHFWNFPEQPHPQNSSEQIDFIYPVEERLKSVDSLSKVAIRGMGLTFIDAALALTEGRGGKFHKTSSGSYSYTPSGHEPQKIYPFSRTGLPMLPKNGEKDNGNKTYYFTEDIVQRVYSSSQSCSLTDLLPLIKREFYCSYYRVLLQNEGVTLHHHHDFSKVKHQVENFHTKFPDKPRFDWNDFEHPFHRVRHGHRSHKMVTDLMRFGIKEAEKGVGKSPFMAAVATWKKISPIFNKIYSFGGLDAPSHRSFDNYYFGLFNRLAYGPPVKNMKKILALAHNGILDFDFAENPKVVSDRSLEIHQLRIEGNRINIDVLINATIPKAKDGKKPGVLLHNLLKRGIVRYYKNETSAKYRPGCIALDHKGKPIDKNGVVNNYITFYGTPTEGITFDNDTLSRKRNDFGSPWARHTVTAIKNTIKNSKNKNENVLLQR